MRKLTLLTAALVVSTPLQAADFSGKQYRAGADPVLTGSLLECHTLNLPTLERDSPMVFAWGVAAGWIEKSAISGTPGYTARVTTRQFNARGLLLGCWVATKIITEQVNGEERAYAQGVYELNDALKGSPALHLAVCKQKRDPTGFTVGDYTVLAENDARSCVTDQWRERLPSLLALRGQTELFKLRRSRGNGAYTPAVGW